MRYHAVSMMASKVIGAVPNLVTRELTAALKLGVSRSRILRTGMVVGSLELVVLDVVEERVPVVVVSTDEVSVPVLLVPMLDVKVPVLLVPVVDDRVLLVVLSEVKVEVVGVGEDVKVRMGAVDAIMMLLADVSRRIRQAKKAACFIF